MENKVNKGAIFKNNDKKTDTHPDYRGGINVDGVEKEVALWLNTSEKGVKYFSVSVSDPYVKPDGHKEDNPTSSEAEDNSGLPF